MTLDRHYVAARQVLLDALEDLAAHRDAIIVVGAQAVYLRTGAANVGVADYTTDGDLAIASDLLADTPLLEDVMSARFNHARLGPAAAEEPGMWTRSVEIDGERIEIPVDLIVPEGIALLIAKAHKIGDRLARPGRPDRLIDKDASDVYRIMLTTPPERINGVVPTLVHDQRVEQPVQRGLELLRAQFGARRAPGVEMAVRALRLGVPEDRIRSVCVSFVAALA